MDLPKEQAAFLTAFHTRIIDVFKELTSEQQMFNETLTYFKHGWIPLRQLIGNKIYNGGAEKFSANQEKHFLKI